MQKSSSISDYKVKQYGNASRKVVFFFCPFGIASWQFAMPGLPIWHLTRRNYRVIAYSYGLAVATISPQITIATIDAIQADALKKISKLGDGVEISCFGSSMGSVLAVNVAASQPSIKKIILNLSYSDISEHIINLPPLKSISRRRLMQYIKAVGGEDNLRIAFQPYSPLGMASKLKEKRVLLYLSRRDRVLRLVHTDKLKTALQSSGVELEYYENKWNGHYSAVIYNSFRYSRYMRFLEKK